MTSNFQSPQSEDISEQDETEAKVRRALGLGSAGSAPVQATHAARSGERFGNERPRSRFVQDGDVPVVMIRRDAGQHTADSTLALGRSTAIRLDAAEKALKTERHAREVAERGLAEALTTIRDLSTKLGHAVLVRDEARANAERSEAEKHALETALTVAHSAIQAAEQRLLGPVAAPRRVVAAALKSEAAMPALAVSTPKVVASVRPRGRAVSTEPKPVKWWVKSK